MFTLGGWEWIVLFVICVVPLVLVGILVWSLVIAAQRGSKTTRKCPYCAETIKADAIVCRYCGRDIPPELADKD